MDSKDLLIVVFIIIQFSLSFGSSSNSCLQNCDNVEFVRPKLGILRSRRPDISHIRDMVTLHSDNLTCLKVSAFELPEQLNSLRNKILVRNLYIEITGMLPEDEKTDNLTLSPLTSFPHLDEIWVYKSHITRAASYIIRYYGPDLPVKRLHIISKLRGETHISNLIRACKDLEVLDLTSAMTFKNPLDEIFSALAGKPLKVLILKNFQSQYKDAIYNWNLVERFKPLSNNTIEYLDLSYNDILYISNDFIKVFPHLKVLDLSSNLIGNDVHADIMYHLLVHPSLVVLILDDLYMAGSDHQSKIMSIDSTSACINQSERHIRQRRFVLSDLYDEAKSCVTGQILTEGIQTFWCHVASCLHWDIPCEAFPTVSNINEVFDASCKHNVRIPLGKNLAELHMNSLGLRTVALHLNTYFLPENEGAICLHRQNKLDTISLNSNELIMHDWEMNKILQTTSFNGINMRYLDLSENNLKLQSFEMFIANMTNLTTLELGGNDNKFIERHQFPICRKYFPNLQTVSLSNGKISSVPSELFNDCKDLSKIDLSHNKIEELDLELGSTGKLNEIILTDTAIKSITKRTQDQLDNLGESLTLNLTGTIMSCHCDHLQTIMWIQTTTVNIVNRCDLTCSDPFSPLGLNTICNLDARTSWTKNCTSKEAIQTIGTTVFIVVLLVITVLILYKYRFRIRTAYYRLQWKINQRKNSNKAINYEFDAFVAYCAEDRFWVHNTMIKELEDKHGFKLVIHYRDFPVGPPIADTILRFMSKSKATIAVMSEYSVKSSWIDFEIQHADMFSRSAQKRLIPIKLGEIPRQEQTPLMRSIMDGKTYIKWPDIDPDDRKENVNLQAKVDAFWERILLALHDLEPTCHGLHCGKRPISNYLED